MPRQRSDAAQPRSSSTLALSVHGPAGAIDVVVPAGATGLDLARDYARQLSLPALPHLYDASGRGLPAHDPLSDAGVRAGAVLVAVATPTRVEAHVRSEPTACAEPGGRVARTRSRAVVGLGSALPAVLALIAGWWAGAAGEVGAGTSPATVTAVVLAATAVLALAPFGRHVEQRALAAPAYAAGATLAVVGTPDSEQLPIAVGTAALTAAATAAVARSWRDEPVEGLTTWMVVGAGTFAVAATATLVGLGPAVVWSVLLAAAVLGARFAGALAVDVPDEALLDLDRLAVTAWSAHDTKESRRSRRARSLVTDGTVTDLAARGSRLVDAGGVAVAALALVSAPLLVASAPAGLDRVGAVVQVSLSATAFLLTARGNRHAVARLSTRAAGLGCAAALLVAPYAGVPGPGRPAVLGGAAVAVLLGGACLLAAVVTGRGGRSPWWSRRADQAEAAAGAGALAAVVVTTGLFRLLWETTS